VVQPAVQYPTDLELPISLPLAHTIIVAQHNRILQLETHIEKLEARIGELEARLNNNSSNSSAPPSSDKPWDKQKKPPFPNKKSGKKRGGQPGHPGHHRPLLPSDQVDATVDYSATQCVKCGEVLCGDDEIGEVERYQTSEVPPVKTVVTEHRACDRRCKCGTINTGRLPNSVRESAFGPRAQALVGTLAGRYQMPRSATRECLDQIFGLQMSDGTIQRIVEDVGDALEAPYNDALEVVRAAPVRHFDETPWYIKNKYAQLWVGTCKTATVFMISKSRASEVLIAWFGAEHLKAGYSVTDRYAGYNPAIPNDLRGICHSHLRRDFKNLEKKRGFIGIIGGALRVEHEAFFSVRHRLEVGEIDCVAFDEQAASIQNNMHDLLQRGTNGGSGKCANMLTYWEPMWKFLSVPEMEPTNNAAERALRPAVIHRKRSLGTHSPAGSRFIERILTVVETGKKHGRNIFEFLVDTVRASIAGDQTPKLIPLPDS
jgi:transposase